MIGAERLHEIGRETRDIRNSTIQNINCFEGMRELGDQSVDLILTDPPYGVTACAWDVAPDLDTMWGEFNRLINPCGAMIIFATQPFATAVINTNRKYFRYDLIWVKNISVGFLNANKMPLRQHEGILVFYKKLPTYNPQMTQGKFYQKRADGACSPSVYRCRQKLGRASSQRYPKSVLNFSRDIGAGERHPTQKPLDLIRWLIRTYSNPGQLVLDPFLGSGTTAVAAKAEGRNFLGFETDSRYFELALSRIRQFVQNRDF